MTIPAAVFLILCAWLLAACVCAALLGRAKRAIKAAEAQFHSTHHGERK